MYAVSGGDGHGGGLVGLQDQRQGLLHVAQHPGHRPGRVLAPVAADLVVAVPEVPVEAIQAGEHRRHGLGHHLLLGVLSALHLPPGGLQGSQMGGVVATVAPVEGQPGHPAPSTPPPRRAAPAGSGARSRAGTSGSPLVSSMRPPHNGTPPGCCAGTPRPPWRWSPSSWPCSGRGCGRRGSPSQGPARPAATAGTPGCVIR